VQRALALSRTSVLASTEGETERFYSTARACPGFGAGLPVPDPRLFTFSQKFGACATCEGRGALLDEDAEEVAGDGLTSTREGLRCPDCRGTRLRPEALAVKVVGRSIGEVAALTVRQARVWLRDLGGLPAELEEAVMPELEGRLRVL
jgi:excinuclease ABC subunit A